MMLKALIVEQLDADGMLKTFRMQPSEGGSNIIVAFVDEYEFGDEYEDHRSAPFTF